ncbi:MAG: rRNA adenine N-6-methyltransferase family protein [Candidatus Dojkabacteria bacterium]
MQPNKYKYSQVFLKDPTLVSRLIKLSDIQSSDIMVEIGAGEGIITKELSKVIKKGQIYAIEPDSFLFGTLEKDLKEKANMHLLNLEISEFKWPLTSFKIFSNIPFNSTSEILNTILNPNLAISSGFLILQKEAVNMYTEENSIKSLLAYPFFDLEITHVFSRNDFIPSPNVDTVMLKIKRRNRTLIDTTQFESYRDFLYFISIDRVGEGNWKKIFKREQLDKLGLICGRGIKQQRRESILETFKAIEKDQRLKETKGSYKKSISRPLEKHFRTRVNRMWTKSEKEYTG